MSEALSKLLLLVMLVTCVCGCSETRQSVTAEKADVIPTAQDIALVDTEPEPLDHSSTLVDQADGAVDISEHDGSVAPDPGLTIDAAAAPLDTAKPVGQTLVVVTLNTHSFQEGPVSIEKLEQIGQGLAALDVDLVGLNEVMSGTFWAYDYGGAQYDGAEIIEKALEKASGHEYYSARHGFAHWAEGEEMSNVLLSRLPILDSDHQSLTTTDFWPGPKEQRSVLSARVAIPDIGPVNVFVTHTAGWDSADTEIQITEVKAFMAEKHQGDEVVELLFGDLNTPSTYPAYESWLHAVPFELIDTYAAANPSGFTDSTLVGGEHRIDYIFAREGSSASSYSSTIAFDGDGLPVVSDHYGVKTMITLPAP